MCDSRERNERKMEWLISLEMKNLTHENQPLQHTQHPFHEMEMGIYTKSHMGMVLGWAWLDLGLMPLTYTILD